MLFSEVVGQKEAKDGLLKMWHNNTLPHAIMISGAEGLGGLPLALALTQYIFCENKTGNDACGHCPGCSKASKLEHADLHLSFPSVSPKPGVKAMSRLYMSEFREFVKQTPYGTTYEWLQFIDAENKQGNITADECREIIDTLNLKSYEGGIKVLLMWRPEYLGKEGNILLKLIEEPPPNTIMIFVAEEIDEVLQTIRSRVQTVKLVPVPATEIANALINRANIDSVKASQIAHIAMGSYTEALRLMRSADNDLFPVVRQLFNGIFTNKGVELAKFVDDLSKQGREQQKYLLTYVIHLLENTIKVRYMPDSAVALPDTEANFVRKLANQPIPFEGFTQMVTALTETINFIERNAHSKTQMHALVIKLHHIVLNKQIPV